MFPPCYVVYTAVSILVFGTYNVMFCCYYTVYKNGIAELGSKQLSEHFDTTAHVVRLGFY